VAFSLDGVYVDHYDAQREYEARETSRPGATE